MINFNKKNQNKYSVIVLTGSFLMLSTIGNTYATTTSSEDEVSQIKKVSFIKSYIEDIKNYISNIVYGSSVKEETTTTARFPKSHSSDEDDDYSLTESKMGINKNECYNTSISNFIGIGIGASIGSVSGAVSGAGIGAGIGASIGISVKAISDIICYRTNIRGNIRGVIGDLAYFYDTAGIGAIFGISIGTGIGAVFGAAIGADFGTIIGRVISTNFDTIINTIAGMSFGIATGGIIGDLFDGAFNTGIYSTHTGMYFGTIIGASIGLNSNINLSTSFRTIFNIFNKDKNVSKNNKTPTIETNLVKESPIEKGDNKYKTEETRIILKDDNTDDNLIITEDFYEINRSNERGYKLSAKSIFTKMNSEENNKDNNVEEEQNNYTTAAPINNVSDIINNSKLETNVNDSIESEQMVNETSPLEGKTKTRKITKKKKIIEEQGRVTIKKKKIIEEQGKKITKIKKVVEENI